MKKEYQKPWVVIESFELSEHIASSNCTTSGRANHTDLYSCGFDIGDHSGMIFLDEGGKCVYSPIPPDEIPTEDDLQTCYYDQFRDFFAMFSS